MRVRLVAGFVVFNAVCALAQEAPAPDPEAKRVFRELTKAYQALASYQDEAQSRLHIILLNGKSDTIPSQWNTESKLAVQRPGKLSYEGDFERLITNGVKTWRVRDYSHSFVELEPGPFELEDFDIFDNPFAGHPVGAILLESGALTKGPIASSVTWTGVDKVTENGTVYSVLRGSTSTTLDEMRNVSLWIDPSSNLLFRVDLDITSDLEENPLPVLGPAPKPDEQVKTALLRTSFRNVRVNEDIPAERFEPDPSYTKGSPRLPGRTQVEPKRVVALPLEDRNALNIREPKAREDKEPDGVPGMPDLGSFVSFVTKTDVDGDGRGDFVFIARIEGGGFVLNDEGKRIATIKVQGFDAQIEDACPVEISGKRHWLLSHEEYVERNGDYEAEHGVTLFDPDGVALWRFEPKIERKLEVNTLRMAV
ncbi:MAG: hypothetical protein KDA32_11255, partial [Phycisphaerales bacterium]|nr:hypothetical protein [Phycisphaerales bacterium]